MSTTDGRGPKPAAQGWAPVAASVVRVRRLERGLSGKALAKRCRDLGVSVSVSQISRIERRIHRPRPALRRTLAEVLGLTVMDFEWEPPESPDGHGGAA